MNTLLTVLPFHAGDAAQAEKLCDWIFTLNGNKPIGEALLVADSDVHEEMRAKVMIAAGLAFQTAELVVAPPIDRINKPERINNLFRFAATSVSFGFRTPWFLLEPDCVPIRRTWLADLSLAYFSQSKRFMGPHLKGKSKDGDEIIMLSRTSCYPLSAIRDIEPYCNAMVPFNMLAGKLLVERSSKSRLIQQIAYNHETDHDKIRPDAVILHSDKTGALINHLRAISQPKSEAEAPPIPEIKTRHKRAPVSV